MDWTDLNLDLDINTKEKILNQCIWLNRNLVANKSPLFCIASMSKIHKLYELIDDNMDFKTLDVLKNEFGLKWTFLDHMRFRHTVPTMWKQMLKMDTGDRLLPNPCVAKLKNVSSLKTKDVYWFMLPKVHDIITIPNPIKYWMEKYEFSEDTLQTMYILPFKVTKATYIQSLQYKIMYKIINCNSWLKKIKVKENAKCRFCDQDETVEHFFYQCIDTKKYWKSILNWWNHLDLMYVEELFEYSVILGMAWSDHVGKVFNCCILVGKLVIYKNKNMNIQPTLRDFLIELKTYISIDENISIKNGKQSTFELEWGEINVLI
jgi:hypothetical protein